MRTIPTASGGLRQVPNVTACSSCGHTFASPDFTTSWFQCSCTPDQRGHIVFVCLRGDCRAETFDPPCTAAAPAIPLEGHRVGPRWDDVQHGPLLDLGEG